MTVETFGRQPVVIVELVQDFCTLTFGTLPCTATGAVGTECYNTWQTCRARPVYSRGTRTIRMCEPIADMPADWRAIPSVVEVTRTPGRINVGARSNSSGALGERSSGVVTVLDHPSSDLDLDPYHATRGFDPAERGTFWTKWLARNPHHVGRPLRLRYGYLGQTLESMTVHHQVVERVEWPDAEGRVRLHYSDLLGLASDDKAQAPRASRGTLRLAITAGATSLEVVGSTLAEYAAAPGTLRIRSEVLTYASATEAAGVITFGGLTRGSDGTAAAAHAAGDSVQRCLRYTNATPDAVLRDLLVTWAGLRDDQLDLAGWAAERTRWLVGYELTALLTEPVGVSTLVSEIAEQVQLVLWLDERVGLVRMAAVRPPLEAPPTLTEREHVLADSMRVRADPAQRLSQVWLYFLPVDPTRRLDETTNYREVRVRVDAASEGPNAYGTMQVRKIHSRWLRTSAVVNDIQLRMLARYRDDVLVVALDVDAKDAHVTPGSFVTLDTRLILSATGQATQRQFIVVQAEAVEPGHRVSLLLHSVGSPGQRTGRYTDAVAPTYAAATPAEREAGAWYSRPDGVFPDGSEGYTYI